LEDDFWHALKEIADGQDITVRELVLKIDNERATTYRLQSACKFSATIAIAVMQKPKLSAGPLTRLANARRLRVLVTWAAVPLVAIIGGCALSPDNSFQAISTRSFPSSYLNYSPGL
jgi:Ribbon-helix-helix domain